MHRHSLGFDLGLHPTAPHCSILLSRPILALPWFTLDKNIIGAGHWLGPGGELAHVGTGPAAPLRCVPTHPAPLETPAPGDWGQLEELQSLACHGTGAA